MPFKYLDKVFILAVDILCAIKMFTKNILV